MEFLLLLRKVDPRDRRSFLAQPYSKEERNTMTTPFTIDLTITLSDGGRLAKQLLNLYTADMSVDINKTAYNLCDANEAVQARKFAELTLKRADVWSSQEGSLKVFARFNVSGEDSTFIEQVIAEYMGGFPDCLRKAADRFFPHAGARPDISLKPTDWNAEVGA